MSIELLQDYGFSQKEAKVYLACLEFGKAPASKIARHISENRITTYSVLKELVKKGIANETEKNNIKSYSVVSPEYILKEQEIKLKRFKNKLPDLMSMVGSYSIKPKVILYEGVEQLKRLFKEIIMEGENMGTEPYYAFVGTTTIDPRIQEFLDGDFVRLRLQCKTKTKAILSSTNSKYIEYHKDNHDSIVIEDPIFELGNEIVIYGRQKVAILIYTPGEVSGVVIDSNTLHNGLKNLFKLFWKMYKNKDKNKNEKSNKRKN